MVENVRDGGRSCASALVIAHGVHDSGRREVISLDVGECETEAFWSEVLRGLVAPGLTGVQLAVSDSHEGLKSAIARVLGCPWQRCAVHFVRYMLKHCRPAARARGRRPEGGVQRRVARAGQRAGLRPTSVSSGASALA